MKRLSSILLLGIFLAGFLFEAPVSEAQTSAQPVLLITNDSGVGKYGRFLGEILHAEGLNYFDTATVSSLNAALLAPYQVVVLGMTALTSGQANDLEAYVNGGGRLIAMQPDAQINDLFGLNSLASTQTDGYLKLSNSASFMGSTPGAGLTAETLQIHGSAYRYTVLGGAAMLAELYSDANTPTGYPAVVGKASGSGWAVAYTYDLPANIILTRQGNPAKAGVDGDGDGITRTIDLFQGTSTWVDLEKVPVPQADEQMRFFSRLVKLQANMPLPQLWYFPDCKKTILVITSDAHANPTSYYLALMDGLAMYGAHDTIYLSQGEDQSLASLESWIADGHSFGIHPYQTKDDYSPPITNLTEGYQAFADWFQAVYGLPYSATVRNHTVAWEGWTDAVNIETAFGIRMDTNFYHWGPWLKKADETWAHGYITGSGLPMKFSDINGNILPVYQQLTQLVDEQLIATNYPLGMVEDLTGAQGLLISQALIDASQAGYYSALMTQFHVDYYNFGEVETWVNGTMAYAQSLGIPMWNADEWLAFTEGRDATVYQNLNWNLASGVLTFTLDAPVIAGGNFTTLVPAVYQGNGLVGIQVDGAGIPIHTMDVNGVQMATVTLPGGVHDIAVSYYSDADLSITMTDNPDPVLAGNNLTYAMTVHNNGPDTAQNVVVSDTLPAGTSLISATATQGTCGGTSQISCALGTISPGGNVGVSLVVKVDPAKRSGIDNTATVSAQTIDSHVANNTATTHTTVNAAADVRITLADSPDPVTAGTNLTYTLTVTNAGPSTANGVSAVLTLGAGLTYQGSSGAGWSCTQAPVGTVTCTRSSALGVTSDSVQVTAVVDASQSGGVSSTASVTASETDGNPGNNSDAEPTSVTRSADMGITLSDSPNPVTAGTNLTYTMAVSNAGPSTANGVSAVLTLDSGLTYQGFSGANWSCTQAPVGTVTCGLSGTLAASGNASVQVTARVAASQSASVSSTASVTASEADGNSSNNSQLTSTNVSRSADVGITLMDAPDPVTAGTTLTYTLAVTNAGPSTANGVSAVLTLGSGLTYQGKSGANWACTESPAGTVTCNRTSALGVASDSVQVTVVVAASQSTNVSSSVIVTASETDGNTSDNSASASTAVTRSADVGIALTDAPDPVTAGTTLTYTLAVSNAGPSTANGVSATLVLGTGLAYQGNSGVNWTCAESPVGSVTCTRTSALGVGSDSVQVTARVAASQSGSVSSTASVTASETDGNSSNNSTSPIVTTVMRSADVGIALTGTPDPVTAGTTLTYTLLVSNTGPSAANGVSTVLTLGTGLTYQGFSGINWVCMEGPVGAVACTRGSALGVNGSDSVQVTAQVNPAQNVALSSTVVVTSDETDPSGGNNQNTVETTVDRKADISIEISDAPDPIAASRNLTYTLTVQNTGPSTAEAVAVTDTLPLGVTYTGYASADWTCQHNAGVVTCDPRLLQPGTSGTIQIVVTAPSEQGVIENLASVSSSTPDNQTGNNSASAFTSVTAETDLSIQIGVNQDPAQAGIPLEYILSVSNLGVSSTTGVGVTFTLPAGAGFVSASGNGWTCGLTADMVTCTMTQLPVGEAAPVTVRLLAPTTGSDMIAHAAVSSANADPVMENNTTQLTTALKHVQYLPVVTIQP